MHAFSTFKTTRAQNLYLSKPLMHMSPPYKYIHTGRGFTEKVKQNNKAVCRKEELVFWWTSPSKTTCGLKRQVVPGQGPCLCKYAGEGFRDHGTLKRGAPSLQGGLLSECLLDWGHLQYLTGEITKNSRPPVN